MGYGPWVPKESDMTEKLTPSLSSYTWIPKPVTCKGNGITMMGLGKLHPHKSEMRLPTLTTQIYGQGRCCFVKNKH